MILKFNQLSVGDVFKFSGIEHCIKKSARTAYINKEKTLWFYFGKNEVCKLIESILTTNNKICRKYANSFKTLLTAQIKERIVTVMARCIWQAQN